MKLDLILENIRNRYSLGLLEESEGMSEKELLKGKILINESTMAVRSMLVEEGTMEAVKANLSAAWTQALLQEEFDMSDILGQNTPAPTETMMDYPVSRDGGLQNSLATQAVPSQAAQAAQRFANDSGTTGAMQTARQGAAELANRGANAIRGGADAVRGAVTGAGNAVTGAVQSQTGTHDLGAFKGTGLQTNPAVTPDVVKASTPVGQGVKDAGAAVAGGAKSLGTTIGGAVDSAGQFANANRGLTAAGIAGAGLMGYGAQQAGRNLAGVVRARR